MGWAGPRAPRGQLCVGANGSTALGSGRPSCAGCFGQARQNGDGMVVCSVRCVGVSHRLGRVCHRGNHKDSLFTVRSKVLSEPGLVHQPSICQGTRSRPLACPGGSCTCAGDAGRTSPHTGLAPPLAHAKQHPTRTRGVAEASAKRTIEAPPARNCATRFCAQPLSPHRSCHRMVAQQNGRLISGRSSPR